MSKKTIEAEGLCLILSIQNNSTAKFEKETETIKSGKSCSFNTINNSSFTEQAFSGWFMESIFGFNGSASWSYTIPETNKVAQLSLVFSMPIEGGNSGLLSGNNVFQEHFEIAPNISMPSNGMYAHLKATINNK